MSWPSPHAEALAARLRRTLQSSPGFSLCFLFSPSLQESEACHDWLAHWLAGRADVPGCQLETMVPLAIDDWRNVLVHRVTSLDRDAQTLRIPLWVQLDRAPHSPEADRLRNAVLQALNERRRLIESTFGRPLIIVLPQGFNQQVWHTAPALWTMRDFVGELPALPEGPVVPPSGEADFDFAFHFAPVTPVPLDNEPTRALESLPAVQEWRRVALFAQENPDAVTPQLAFRAIESARSAGQLLAAQAYAEQAVQLARARLNLPGEVPSLERRHELLQALDRLGEVAAERRVLDVAAKAYQERLQMLRADVARDGAPQARRELAFALLEVGKLAQVAGAWGEAETIIRESEAVFRSLSLQQGKGSEAQRDLSVALLSLGSVALLGGDWPEAERVYHECLDISRARAKQTDTPHVLHDLSVALDGVGHVAEVQGNWADAEIAYRESLTIRRELAVRAGETPQSLEDLALSLMLVGNLERARGETCCLRDAEALLSRLIHMQPHVLHHQEHLDEVHRLLFAAPLSQSDTLAN